MRNPRLSLAGIATLLAGVMAKTPRRESPEIAPVALPESPADPTYTLHKPAELHFGPRRFIRRGAGQIEGHTMENRFSIGSRKFRRRHLLKK